MAEAEVARVGGGVPGRTEANAALGSVGSFPGGGLAHAAHPANGEEGKGLKGGMEWKRSANVASSGSSGIPSGTFGKGMYSAVRMPSDTNADGPPSANHAWSNESAQDSSMFSEPRFSEQRSRKNSLSRSIRSAADSSSGYGADPQVGAFCTIKGSGTGMRRDPFASNLKYLMIGGEPVTLINDEHFAKIRHIHGVTADQLNFEMFSFSNLTAGGGKGGSLMQFTKNQTLLVKQLSKDDRASLNEYGAAYCRHVLNGVTPSLLTRFFYHFTRHKDGMDYVVMNNCMPPMRAVEELWDLKGCCDDKVVRDGGVSVPQVHKRWFMLHWLVAEAFGDCVGILPLGRKRYKAGKTRARTQQFKLEFDDWNEVMTAVKFDVQFLKACGLCDYSLIIGSLTEEIKPHQDRPEFPAGPFGRQPYVVRKGGWWVAYYIGIIDFLQGWTSGKKVAHIIKVGFAPKPISTIQPDEYATQFQEANEVRFIALPKPEERANFKVEQNFVFKSNSARQPAVRVVKEDESFEASAGLDEAAIQQALEGLQHLEKLRYDSQDGLKGAMSTSGKSGWTGHAESIADSVVNTGERMKEFEGLQSGDC